MENLKNISFVKIIDETNYDPRKCNNGGCYRYTQRYYRVSESEFEVRYGTSSEFDYCKISGTFQRCEDCSDSDWGERECQAEPEKVSETELLKIIQMADSHEHMYVREEE